VKQNNELNQNNDNVDRQSQVQFFLDGIKADKHNPTISAIFFMNSNHQQKGTYSKKLLLLRTRYNAIRTAISITKTLIRLGLHTVKVWDAMIDMVDMLNVTDVEDMEDVEMGTSIESKNFRQRISLFQMKSFKQYLKVTCHAIRGPRPNGSILASRKNSNKMMILKTHMMK
jgi:hypothetical protein